MDNAIHVIWNPSAGPAGPGSELRQHLNDLLRTDVVVTETESPEHAKKTVRRVAADAELIVAAGGDGTINAVINALMACPRRPRLGLLPMGTGNDLCRSLGIPLDPLSAIDVLTSELTRLIDLIHIDARDCQLYYANVASGGNSDRVIQSLNKADKGLWGPWTYLRFALPVMAELTGFETRVEFDYGPVEQFRLWNALVANGKHAAGGLPVARSAKVDDGLLDVVLILDGTPLDMAVLASEFFLADYLQDERVIHRRAKTVRIEAEPELRFLADGEMLAGQPFRFAVEPNVLEVVVGEGGPSGTRT